MRQYKVEVVTVDSKNVLRSTDIKVKGPISDAYRVCRSHMVLGNVTVIRIRQRLSSGKYETRATYNAKLH